MILTFSPFSARLVVLGCMPPFCMAVERRVLGLNFASSLSYFYFPNNSTSSSLCGQTRSRPYTEGCTFQLLGFVMESSPNFLTHLLQLGLLRLTLCTFAEGLTAPPRNLTTAGTLGICLCYRCICLLLITRALCVCVCVYVCQEQGTFAILAVIGPC